MAILLALVLITIPISRFVNKVRRNEIAIADQTLLTAANNGVTLIQTVFNSYMTNITNTALLYEQYENLTGEEALGMLQTVAQRNGYDRLAVDFPDGRTYTSDGFQFDMSQFGYLDKIARGESFITNVLPALADGVETVSFITPLRDRSGVPVAGLRLTMETASMAEAINLTLFGGEGYYHLVDENGNYVAAVQESNALLMDQNFFDAIAAMDYDKGFSSKDIENAFTMGESGFTRYSVANSTRYAYCQPAGINNWVLMTIVPQETITRAERANIFFATAMAVQLSGILSLLFACLYFFQQRMRKVAELNDRCFRALAEQTSKVIFEWDFVSGKIVAMNNFRALFGREMATRSSADQALSAGMIHPKDQEVFEGVFSTLAAGQNIENVRFRVKHANGDFHWCLLSGIVIFDHDKRPYKAIGSLEDIHKQVLSEVQMKSNSEIDRLTGIYNKATTEEHIQSILANCTDTCALMIIDIDNFKNINDSLGHPFGDRVLVDFAKILKSVAGKGDVVGRIGGDEFFVFFQNPGDESNILARAAEICGLLAKSYSNAEQSCDLSASVGVSIFPRDGRDFAMLYKRADIALYRTKSLGKNNYTLYNIGLGNEVSTRTKIDSTTPSV